MKNSHIEWCTHSFNAWLGCERVSAACVRCYIERSPALRFRGLKIGDAPVRTSESYWRQPLQWNKEAEDEVTLARFENVSLPERQRVFCLSLGDWLDDRVPIEWLADLLKLVAATPNLDWQLLTKRPENFWKRIDAVWRLASVKQRNDEALYDFVWAWQTAGGRGGHAPENVWIGTTAENQAMLDQRVPQLLNIPACIRFLSCEPLLGPLNLRARPSRDLCIRCGEGPNAPHNHPDGYRTRGLDWIICGGETGPGARPMHPAWARGLRDQCRAAGVPFFFKQWGDWAPAPNFVSRKSDSFMYLDGHGRSDSSFFTEASAAMIHVGKRAAGRLLDGREWNEFPNVEVTA